MMLAREPQRWIVRAAVALAAALAFAGAAGALVGTPPLAPSDADRAFWEAFKAQPSQADTLTFPGGTIYWDRRSGSLLHMRTAALPPQRGDAATLARQFLSGAAQPLGLPPGLDGLSQPTVVSSLSGQHVHFVQTYRGVPVLGGLVSVHLNRYGAVRFVTNRYRTGVQVATVTPKVPAGTAVQLANAAVQAQALRGPSQPSLAIVPSGGKYALAWQVIVPSAEPLATWMVFVDAGTGAVLAKKDLLKRVTGSGMVFDPNPITASGDPNLRGDGGGDTPELTALRVPVSLRELSDTGFLVGAYVRTWPTYPRVWQPTYIFNYTRARSGFEEVMCYYHVDRVERYIQSLGFDNVMHRSIGCDAHYPIFLNAFYDPYYEEMYFGSEQNLDLAEDADVIIHEYGHAVQDNQVKWWGMLYEGGSMGEGFGDYLAASVFADKGPADWRTFVGEWAFSDYSNTTPPYLRRVDTPKKWPNDRDEYMCGSTPCGDVHADGEIWSAALWDIRQQLGGPDTDRLVIESHFFLDPYAEFLQGAEALLAADQELYDGAHQDTIAQIMYRRGLLRNPSVPRAHIGITNVVPGLGPSLAVTNTVTVTIGVGDPASPAWSRVVFVKRGMNGSPSDSGWWLNVDLDEDISDAPSQYLPPSSSNPWFLKVDDVTARQLGSLWSFAITMPDGKNYQATNLPQALSDTAAAYAYIPDSGSAPSSNYAKFTIDHPEAGDLVVRIGAGDPMGPKWWKDVALADLAGQGVPILSGVVDLRSAARYLPPSESNHWFLEVFDNSVNDRGQLTAFEIISGGQSYVAHDVPQSLSDFTHVLSFIPSHLPEPYARVEIQHAWRGDLTAAIGVGDPANPDFVRFATLIQGEDADNLYAEVDLSFASAYLPPSNQHRWWVRVVDDDSLDSGLINRFSIKHQGQTYLAEDTPVSTESPGPVYSYIPRRPLPFARVDIDLLSLDSFAISIGVGAPDSPAYEKVLSSYSGGSARYFYRDIDLSDMAAFLPPTQERPWFLRVDPIPAGYWWQAGQFEPVGLITRFAVRDASGTWYTAVDVPVRVGGEGTAFSLIPGEPPASLFADVAAGSFARTSIESCWRNGVMDVCGYSPPMFCPKDLVRRRDMARYIIWGRGGPAYYPSTPTFGDVAIYDPDWGYVEAMRRLKITSGCSASPPLFCPDANVTRKEMVTFLVRTAGGQPYDNPTPTFADVPATHPFYGYIEAGVQMGLVAGCASTPQRLFCPDASVNREQMAVFLVRTFKLPLWR